MRKTKRITEKVLFDNFVGISHGLFCISKIDNGDFFWSYRKNEGRYHPLTFDRDKASYICVEREIRGKIFRIPLQVRTSKHPKLAEINLLFKTILDIEGKNYEKSK